MKPMRAVDKKTLILIDAHVHIYACFSLPVFFDSAFQNFRAGASRTGHDGAFYGILLLTESSEDNWFSVLYEQAAQGSSKHCETGSWSLQRTNEDNSLALRRDGQCLLLIAGRQIVTAENLEVLALCTASSFKDRLPLATTVAKVREAGGLPAIPWGAGKWLGRRGAILTGYLRSQPAEETFLGDNSARPLFWRYPRHFEQARQRGIRILPGTDPLPFPSEVSKPGSFGFAVKGTIRAEHPTKDIKRLLRDPSTIPEPFGSLERPYQFFRNQFAMQIRKHARRRLLR